MHSVTKKSLSIVAVLTAVMLMGVTPAAASRGSAFCSPHRTLQSFGGEPRQGFSAHLVAAPGSVRPGTYGSFRIINEGSDELAEGDEIVQRWTGSSWRRMPEAGGPKVLALAFALPQSVSGCLGPLTGEHWKVGKFRFLLKVEAIEKSEHPTGGPIPTHWLGATFRLRGKHAMGSESSEASSRAVRGVRRFLRGGTRYPA